MMCVEGGGLGKITGMQLISEGLVNLLFWENNCFPLFLYIALIRMEENIQLFVTDLFYN